MVDLRKIATEQRNPRTTHIDELSTLEMVKLINSEDHKVAEAVEAVCPQIAKAVDAIAERLRQGGRLIYVGCGTSGRLGILDAVECPPTYSTEPEMVQGLIAGGMPAIYKAVEGAEDDRELGAEDLKGIRFSEKDVLVGIAASGRTPYVLGAMEYAKKLGAPVIGVSCCPGSQVDEAADIGIAPTPGPEVVTGSTRMKSGTAQKMILNMLSTGAMIRLGKVYGNRMVDMDANNEKLRARAARMVTDITGCPAEEAAARLTLCGYDVKRAISSLWLDCGAGEAAERLAAAGGNLEALCATERGGV